MDKGDIAFVQSTQQDPEEDVVDVEQPSKKLAQPTSTPTTLKCSRCKRDLAVEMFYKTTNYWCCGRGYSYVCRECSKISARMSREKKLEKANETATINE